MSNDRLTIALKPPETPTSRTAGNVEFRKRRANPSSDPEGGHDRATSVAVRSGETTADRVMGHRPEVLEAWENLRAALLGPSSTLPLQLKEEVRRTLAQQTGCRFCASLGQPSPDHATRRESLAVAFADAVASDHTAISDAQVRVLFDEFTLPEVVELLVWISFEYAGQLFGGVIADEPATEEKHAFATSIAELATAHADSTPPATSRHGEL